MTQLFTWGGMVLCMMLGLGLSAGLTKKNYQPLGALVSPYDGTDEAPDLVEKTSLSGWNTTPKRAAASAATNSMSCGKASRPCGATI